MYNDVGIVKTVKIFIERCIRQSAAKHLKAYYKSMVKVQRLDGSGFESMINSMIA